MFKLISKNKLDAIGVFLPFFIMIAISVYSPFGWWDAFLVFGLLFNTIVWLVNLKLADKKQKEQLDMLFLIRDINEKRYNSTCKYFNCSVHPKDTDCRNCADYDSLEKD